MSASKAQQKATNKYIAKAYDRINLTVVKGKKDIIQAHADLHGESVNGFINRAITETMERDTSGSPQKAAESFAGGGVVSLHSETIKAAEEAAEAAGEALPVFVGRAVETQAQRDALSRRMKGGKPNE